MNGMQDLLIRWLQDPMHIEVNVAKNLIDHMYGVRNSDGVRVDAKEVGVVKHAWLRASDGKRPRAHWILPRPT